VILLSGAQSPALNFFLYRSPLEFWLQGKSISKNFIHTSSLDEDASDTVFR